jgi:hypothetical protein
MLRVHDEYRWVEIRRVLEYRLAPADVGIAERLVEMIEKNR